MIEFNKIYNEDCLEGMKRIPDKSVDMILCDLPYGTTACKWDTIIPFEPLWEQYNRIIKDNGAIVLTASQPFTSVLINSNINDYRYNWVWNKKISGNPFLAKYQPLKIHEDVCVFSKKTHVYKPIKTDLNKTRKYKDKYGGGESFGKKGTGDKMHETKGKYPVSILEFSNARRKGNTHPTQKPVPLFEYLIKTYTNEGDTVLDNCMGSGTTAVAALNTGRNFIGFELDETYYNLSNKRIEDRLQEVGE